MASLFSVLPHLVVSQALFTHISIPLSILVLLPFSHKLVCCNTLLPGLPAYTLSALHSKLIFVNDSFDLISNFSEVSSSSSYLQNFTLFISTSVVWLPLCLPDFPWLPLGNLWGHPVLSYLWYPCSCCSF